MNKRYEARVEELKRQKRADERIECVADISGASKLITYIVIAAVAFVIGRFFPGKFAVMMFTNIVSIWMMIDAARVLADTQDACLLITTKRIFGKSGREINLFYRDIESVQLVRQDSVFIRAGNDHRSVMVRNLRNQREVYLALKKHIK